MSKIFRKTLVAVVLVFGITANATALLSAWLLYSHLTEAAIARVRGVALSIAAAGGKRLAQGDTTTLQPLVDAIARNNAVDYAVVLDRQGRELARSVPGNLPAGLPLTAMGGDPDHPITVDTVRSRGQAAYLQVTAPIRTGLGGWVAVGLNKDHILHIMRSAVLRQEALMLVMLAVAVGVFYVLVKSVTQPLVDLARYAVKIRDHDFSAVPPPAGNDEVGVLARAMRSMADELAAFVTNLTRAVTDSTRERNDTLAHTRAIIDHLADGLLVIDPVGAISLFNPALLTMFGLEASNIAGQPAATFFPEDMAALGSACRNEAGLASAEVRLPGGGTGKALATAVQLGDGVAERRATVVLVRDITQEKEVDRMKTEFISTVSHELRTPLTSVLGFAKIIRRRFLDEIVPALPTGNDKVQRFAAQIGDNLAIIMAEGRRLTELVGDVLDIAKMEAGRYEWHMESLSLAEVAEHAVRTVEPLAARKGLAVTHTVPADLPRLLGDRDRLIQVLLNLLGNAVKFTQQGSITLEAAMETGQIRVAVRDTGPGLAPTDLERVFEKFKQAGNTLTEKPKGTGLGLPICRQIVEHHGGRIWAESRVGQGATFLFTLPVGREAQACRAPACALPTNVTRQPAATNGRRRVLVVDDDAAVRHFLETVLTDAGFAVALAGDGQEALRLAASWQPECITMDLRMPGMDGVATIRALRADVATRAIPVVVVSVLSARERAGIGADAAVVKPVDQDALVATVRGLLEGYNGSGRPYLVYSPDAATQSLANHFLLLPGEAVACDHAAALWQSLARGFHGTVFVPASREHDLDLAKLSALPDIRVIIMPG